MGNRRRVVRRRRPTHHRRRGRGFFDFLKPVANLYGKITSGINDIARPILPFIPGPAGTILNLASKAGTQIGKTFEGVGVGKYHRRLGHGIRISHHHYSRWKHA
jgi:hypothetical protein